MSVRFDLGSTPRQHWLAGLTWRGVGLIVFLCIINALRRKGLSMLGEDTFSEWLIAMAQLTAWGLIIAVPVALAVIATYNLGPRRALFRNPALALAVAASSLTGVAVAFAVQAGVECGGSFEVCFRQSPLATTVNAWVRYGPLCALFSVVFVYLRVADESAARAQAAQRDRVRFVQRMEEARLKMLQAQIEPHFLFNTLANVRRLYQTDPALAESMLDSLMRYFAVALPQMRAAASTLGREAALTQSYLAIQQVRMGHRLAFGVDIPEPLHDAELPPMMLVTLTENAIKHGLAPLPEGGTVRISAAVSGGELQVRVADSGRGFTQSSGGGTGLANIRGRLAGMYGAAGRLTLALNTPRGVIATLALPLSFKPSTVASP